MLSFAEPKRHCETTGAAAVSGSAETVLLRDTFAVHRIRRAARDRLRARFSAAPNTAKKRRRPVSSRTPLPKNTDALAARDGEERKRRRGHGPGARATGKPTISDGPPPRPAEAQGRRRGQGRRPRAAKKSKRALGAHEGAGPARCRDEVRGSHTKTGRRWCRRVARPRARSIGKAALRADAKIFIR